MSLRSWICALGLSVGVLCITSFDELVQEKPQADDVSQKLHTLARVESGDHLSSGTESDGSSGNESSSIETDEEASSRLKSLESEDPAANTRKTGGSDGVNLDDSVSVIMNIPFKKLAMRQDSVLFEEDSKPDQPVVNPGPPPEESIPDIALEDYPSDHEHRIKSAVERLNTRSVIGDGTVLARLLHGEFTKAVGHFVIIDCRYPYEYNGGHIKGATNMYCGESVDEILSWRGNKDDETPRTVLIFHCEFSSQRAPTMMRLLRSADRQRNSHCYPYLCYPEIYLLSGGYKLFFQRHPELCDPSSYTPMNHRNFLNDLKLFRSKATTWHGEVKLKKHVNSLIF